MRLSNFARLIPAPPKWVQNAAAVLGLRLGYTIPEARALSLARSISDAADIPLKAAYPMAVRALQKRPDAFAAAGRPRSRERTEMSLADSPDGSVTIRLDMARFASGFLARQAGLEGESPSPARRSPGAEAMLEGLTAAEIRFGVIEGDADELTITYDPAPDNAEPLAAVLRAWKAYPRGVPAGAEFVLDGKQLGVTPAMRLTTVLGDIRVVRAESFA